jgi:hypothetical protein
MNKPIERFSGLVNGCIAGFDRIVFKGFILPLEDARLLAIGRPSQSAR